LSVLGRSCDLVQKDGGVFFAPDIERCASSEPLWRGRTIVAVPLPVASPDEQRLAIFVTPPAGQRTEANDSEVADVMARRLQAVLPVDADYLVPVRSLPRTTSGKIQRSRLAEDFMAGKYRETAIPLPSALRKEGF
jgi:acyl-CoA synthetase (AMP-forming)/AMP-acid ligase II